MTVIWLAKSGLRLTGSKREAWPCKCAHSLAPCGSPSVSHDSLNSSKPCPYRWTTILALPISHKGLSMEVREAATCGSDGKEEGTWSRGCTAFQWNFDDGPWVIRIACDLLGRMAGEPHIGVRHGCLQQHISHGPTYAETCGDTACALPLNRGGPSSKGSWVKARSSRL